MAYAFRNFAGALAGGALLTASCIPAMALDLGVSISGGSSDRGSQSLDADADVSIGDSAADVDASLRLGGSSAAEADVNLDLGGGGADADASLRLGGSDGVAGDVDLRTGNGTTANANLNLGGTDGANANVAVGALGKNGVSGAVDLDLGIDGVATGSTAVASTRGGIAGILANMSDSELTKFRTRCSQVLSNSAGYDADLVALCAMVRSASR